MMVKKFYHVDIRKEAKRVDTTGVGDAFNQLLFWFAFV